MISLVERFCSMVLNQGFLMISLIEGCCSKVLNQMFLSWFPWSRDVAVRYWSKVFYHHFLDPGMLQLGTKPMVSTVISLIHGCCSKVLNQGFLSWFSWSRDAAVRYWTNNFYHYFPWSRDASVRIWTMGFYHNFFVPWSRDAAVRYWTKGFYRDFLDRRML
jgi:hypothetical protein